MKGTVFNIQRYSLNDGIGIRTLVFMKGCPLQCLWCSNPEGISDVPSLMFNEQKCYGCGKCIEICPENAITFEGQMISWHRDICSECMKCVSVCIPHAKNICGTEYTVEALMTEIEKDSIFYGASGGGVTVGGGDPLMQAGFVSEFLKTCKNEYGFNTAIETSAFAVWEDVKRVFDYVDIFYIDIKHMDAAIHKKLTGVDNTLILENIRKVAVHYDFNWRSLIIRMPVIPGYNSSDDNVGTLFQFVKDLKVVKRVDLLPYHNLGSVKYDRIKFPNDYQLHDLDAIAPDALLLQIKDIGESMGVTVGIGG